MGVISAILLCAGVLRHYWDIYIHRTVRGISFIFVAIDAAGDVFSLISVCTFLSFLPLVDYSSLLLQKHQLNQIRMQSSNLNSTSSAWLSTHPNLYSGQEFLLVVDISTWCLGRNRNWGREKRRRRIGIVGLEWRMPMETGFQTISLCTGCPLQRVFSEHQVLLLDVLEREVKIN